MDFQIYASLPESKLWIICNLYYTYIYIYIIYNYINGESIHIELALGYSMLYYGYEPLTSWDAHPRMVMSICALPLVE